jgi:hypothetical protein
MTESANMGTISHFGVVVFENGSYARASGSTNWRVQPIPGFGQPIGPPLAQVKILFDPPTADPYTVLVSAQHFGGKPMLSANYGDADATGFVVHLFEPVASRTLQNGNFSFAVVSAAA